MARSFAYLVPSGVYRKGKAGLQIMQNFIWGICGKFKNSPWECSPLLA